MKKRLAALILAFAAVAITFAGDKADLGSVWKIKDEGLNRSQVMDVLGYLTDVYGPRLAGSSNFRRAADWVQGKLAEWGLENVHTEEYDFGRTWELKKFSAHMLEPVYAPLIAFPKAFTPGTNGPIRAEAVRVDITNESDLKKYRGKLKGLFVLTRAPRDVGAHFSAQARRYSEEELKEIERAQDPDQGGRLAIRQPSGSPSRALMRKISAFYASEGVAALLEPGQGDGGTIMVLSGGDRNTGAQEVAPQVVMAVEHYNRICRILDKKIRVHLEVDIQVDFGTENIRDFNVIAELTGTDKKDEIVMLGGHLDSWHSGTGATDNAAGSAVAMEALRILKAAGLRPRRTVRLGLWGGEEQGLLGARAYVREHFASRPAPPENLERGSEAYRAWMEKASKTPPSLKPEYSRFAGYFNFDNGTGKIRGIYLQGNEEVRPIFAAWLAPFNDMGATTVSIRRTGSTDHIAFDEVGLPGFQFIQDEIEYRSRTHHTNMDVYDRIQEEDLMQAAVVMASFVYHTAMREGLLPRKPLP